jgi:hypothetical protein
MTKTERRIVAFSSGIKKLNNHSLNYIHSLTQVLFLIEHPPVYPAAREKIAESEKKNRPYTMV